MLVLLLGGCVGPLRREAPPIQDDSTLPKDLSPGIRWFGENRRDFGARAPVLLEKIKRAAGEGPVNVLVLSGGGAGGAFGAGLLTGWSKTRQRPTFQIVTGVSAGALIAPFAFLGPQWDAALTRVAREQGIGQLQRLHQHVLRLLFGVSVARGAPLASLLDEMITPRLVSALAQGSREGRLLIVATTDLDSEQPVFWNLGAIAEQGGEKARVLIRDVLRASASVPGVFPPVMIPVNHAGRVYDEMHVDGAAAEPLFFIPDVAAVLPGPIDALRGGHIYLILNGTLRGPNEVTHMRAFSILRRALLATLKSGTRAAIELTYQFAIRHDMSIKLGAIPEGYPYAGPLDFASGDVRALFDFGARCALARQIWVDPIDALDRVARRPPKPASSGDHSGGNPQCRDPDDPGWRPGEALR